jgi:hypothetical protein
MPINHVGNRKNAIRLDELRGSTVATLQGRTTGLPIYEVRVDALTAANIGGPNLTRLITSMEKDNLRDLSKRGPGQRFSDLTRQPTDHDDRLGNLPAAPPAYGYREYNIPGNRFDMPGFPRLVADIANKRLFLTPTHYDTWFDDPNAAATQDPARAGGNRSPFFLLRGVFIYNDLFD